ncbi:MAG: phage major capsid protein [Sphingomonas sp.]|nr:phage major capsid protein [Sphingomonas sp.]
MTEHNPLNTINQLADAVDEFKKKHSDRVDRLENNLRLIETRANRPGAAAGDLNADQIAHKQAFAKFLRKGEDDGLGALEMKALNVTTSADGGFAVPEELDRTILDLMRNRATLRSLANVVRGKPGEYRKLVNVHGAGAGWVGETSSRPETATPKLAEVVPYPGELYANPSVSQRMLDDAFFDAGNWLVGELAQEFGLAEGAAFINGDGTNKPKGFLTYTINTSSDGARAFGDLMMIKTGVQGGFVATTSSSNPVDTFISVVQSLAPDYRQDAAWVMNSGTLEAVRRFKDVDGNYIWRPGAEAGAPSLLLGYPVLESPDMPDVASDSYPIAFGDWKRGYLIVDHAAGTRVLRDPFTNKPFVHFYTTKRIGGSVVDSRAIRILATRS